MKTYAGIGARNTPENILDVMTKIAVKLKQKEWLLHSGGAKGADKAFEKGAGKGCTIFTAEHATKEAMMLSQKYHPGWRRCSLFAKKLHARNAFIILGEDLKKPVDMVICWTPKQRVVGGTGQALRIAQAYDIKIYNLSDFVVFKKILQWLKNT